MSKQNSVNELYFAVLPQISLSMPDYGKTGQFLTLLPDRNLATEFFPDEVEAFIQIFNHRQQHLTGGRVTGFDCVKEVTSTGRIIVRVTQNVQ